MSPEEHDELQKMHSHLKVKVAREGVFGILFFEMGKVIVFSDGEDKRCQYESTVEAIRGGWSAV